MKNPAEDLIEHLRESGTGERKLEAVAEVAERCKSLDEFLKAVKEVVPPGTMEKIEKFTAKFAPAKPPKDPPKDPPKNDPAKNDPPK